MNLTLGISVAVILGVCLAGMFGTPIELEGNGGALVINTGAPPLFAINGVIFGSYSDHEYGHYLQQKEYGTEAYVAGVVLPSIATNLLYVVGQVIFDYNILTPRGAYRRLQWEADADLRVKGSVWRTRSRSADSIYKR